jgi:hypothetical protein
MITRLLMYQLLHPRHQYWMHHLPGSKLCECDAEKILTSTEAHLLENLGAWFFTVGLMQKTQL